MISGALGYVSGFCKPAVMSVSELPGFASMWSGRGWLGSKSLACSMVVLTQNNHRHSLDATKSHGAQGAYVNVRGRAGINLDSLQCETKGCH
jgi:hypothetical protein